MKKYIRSGWTIFLSALILIFLQGCRQHEAQPTATAVPTIAAASPTPINTAIFTGITTQNATPLPLPITPSPVATSTISATIQETGQITIGYSVQNRPIVAYPVGEGARKVVVVGGREEAEAWVEPYQNHPETIPAGLTLWLVPDPNPDNADDGVFNANDVSLYENADARFVDCPDQQIKPEINGPYPFSEPESQTLRNFLTDAWLVLFLKTDIATIQPGGCGQSQPSNALAALLAENTGDSVSRVTPFKGSLVDYLAVEGTAAVTLNPNSLNPAVLKVVMDDINQIAGADASASNGTMQWVSSDSSGQRQFPTGTFVHPLAVEHIGRYLYIVDSGRVARLDQQTAAMPQVILAPGDEVAGVQVAEPLDLASDGQLLLVLDRVGDVYAYDPAAESWSVRRYDRPAGETSSHYYLAAAAQPGQPGQHYLLEGSYHFALRQQPDTADFIWPLSEDHLVDITVNQEDVFILSQPPDSQTAGLVHYLDGTKDDGFSPQTILQRPRQVQAVGSLIYVLDRGGRRLVALDADTGTLDSIYLPASGKAWSAFLVDEADGRILFAGQDSLAFFGAPENQAVIQGTGSDISSQMNNPFALENLPTLLMPIGGSQITVRDTQMPGAPRHYRLGIHEGADFYWSAGTPVRAVAAGTVIRAMTDYQDPTEAIFNSWRAVVNNLGYTTAEAEDFYRGRQVWIQHEDGLISRYVHLSAIDPAIREGVTVEAGQTIGEVGNTGSPASLEGPTVDAHLHFELWLDDHYLGQYLRPIETREWLAIILNEH
ncbi:MAG: peptidoglycan DD-metalloendopeptidase family protein [Candidatus Promineifilaceae bacterium]